MEIISKILSVLYPSTFALIVICLSTMLFLMSRQEAEEKSKAKTFGFVVGIITFVIAIIFIGLIIYATVSGQA